MSNKSPKRTFAKDKELASRAGKMSKPPSKGLMELREHKNSEIEEIIYKFMDHSLDELRELIASGKFKMSEGIVINIMIKAFETGDHQRLEAILRRSVGPIKEKLEVSPGGHKSLVDQITEDD